MSVIRCWSSWVSERNQAVYSLLLVKVFDQYVGVAIECVK